MAAGARWTRAVHLSSYKALDLASCVSLQGWRDGDRMHPDAKSSPDPCVLRIVGHLPTRLALLGLPRPLHFTPPPLGR